MVRVCSLLRGQSYAVCTLILQHTLPIMFVLKHRAVVCHAHIHSDVRTKDVQIYAFGHKYDYKCCDTAEIELNAY
jgi:hypothetical protein